jgi:peptide/nickel transport system substrate-binding protein
MARLVRRSLGTVLAASLLLQPALAAEPQKTLLILSDGVPASLDSDGPAGNHPPTQTGFYNMIEPLVQYGIGKQNPDGSETYDFKSFKPALAESWSFDPATNTTTFKLRQGVKSCAGNVFTADDVLYTFARTKSITGQASIGAFLASVASIANFGPELYPKTPEAAAKRALGDEVTKVDDYTLKIRQTAPNQLLLPVLTIFGLLIYDSKEMKAHATAEDPWSHQYANTVNAPSFGPWCLDTWRKDEDFTVRANPEYYGGRPYFDRVIYRRVPQSANRIAILRSGAASVVEGLNPKEFDSLRNVRGVKVVGDYLNSTLLMLLNFDVKPFGDPRIREAIAHALPYDDIVKNSYFGQAHQWRGLIPSAYPGYHTPSVSYNYDLDAAKKLLAEAGYPEGKGLEAFPEAFKLSYAAERESILGPTATLIQTRLRQLGIQVQLDPLPSAQLADRQLVKKDLPFSLYDQSKPIGVDPNYALGLYFLTPPLSNNNMTHFSDKRLDTVAMAARIEADPAKRALLLDEAQEILMQKLPWIPVVETKLQFAVQDSIKGVVLQSSQNLMWRDLHR